MKYTISILLVLVALGCLLSFSTSNPTIAAGSVASINKHGSNEVTDQTIIVDSNKTQRWPMDAIKAFEAWEITSGNPNIKIAVLDTGIDGAHKGLVNKIASEINLTNSPTGNDLYSHGTHVAGIIAAVKAGDSGMSGLAYGCSLMNVKVADDYGRCNGDVIAKGIVWAVDNGAKVVNISLYTTEPSAELKSAIDYAWEKGAIIASPSGNAIGNQVIYPAYYDKCIAVAATDINDSIISWSGKGSWVDVAAPGADIYSTVPCNNYAYKSGTSMATAYVSGLAGLLFGLARDKNGDGLINDEIRLAIENSCDPLNPDGSHIGRMNADRAIMTLLGNK